jgi:hypothetical protein
VHDIRPTLHPGTRVVLNTPDNPRLHGTGAVVVSLAGWGAHVDAPAAATGRFRAAWSEMVIPEANGHARPAPMGDVCVQCGSLNMVRSGSCLTCQDCGTNTGCG